MRDTGVGIPADEVLAMFRPFQRADDTDVREAAGPSSTTLPLRITINSRVRNRSEPSVVSAPNTERSLSASASSSYL